MAVFDSVTGTAKRILEWDDRRNQRLWRVDARAAEYAIIQERPAQGTAAPYRYLLVDAAGKTRPLHEDALPLLDVVLATDGQLAFAAAYEGPATACFCTATSTCRAASRYRRFR